MIRSLFQSDKTRNLNLQQEIHEQSLKWNLDSRLLGCKLHTIETKVKRKGISRLDLQNLLAQQYELNEQQIAVNRKIQENNIIMLRLKEHLENLNKGKISEEITKIMKPKDLRKVENHIIRMGQTFDLTNEINDTIKEELSTALSTDDEEKKNQYIQEELQKKEELELLDIQFTNTSITPSKPILSNRSPLPIIQRRKEAK